ncbi:hypothetical protein [Streptomyces sp. 3214.6]|uniref:hypothetical protein n=1 Tax=Streptomyces sp. 3214.6 TaxID=1882757 RepID=UPI00090C715E|nr:hypothetical protein [Streptomyces sp. 3214.6]SHI65634.1 hypothetical protein SAMN05444521_8153 [Streptomyces sp. 3214.6]
MTATVHIGRRTTPHRPHASFRERWAAFQLRHSRRTQAAYFTRLHDALPLSDPDRYALESPALEDAFARLAADHPEAVTPADGGQAARDADREVLLLAVCDRWFREAHAGPEHRWPPATIAAHQQLLNDVRACFHPGGDA